ncbi:hypothetical protein JCM17823_12820 [Halorubrum gandharaense]
MSPTPFTTGADRDTVPTVNAPDPDTDRGVSNRTERLLSGAVSLVAVVVVAALLGDPLTWSDATPALAGVATTIAVASAVRGV